MAEHETRHEGAVPVDRQNFWGKPRLFSAETMLDRRVAYERDGSVHLRIPEVTGKDTLIIPPTHQWSPINATYDDFLTTVSSVSNSPKLPDGRTLREYAVDEHTKYYEKLEAAQAQGLPEAPVGNYVFDPVYQTLTLIAPKDVFQLARFTSNSLFHDAVQERSIYEIWQAFGRAKGAIAGLSVGSNIAEGLVRNLGMGQLSLADFDYTTEGNVPRIARAGQEYLVLPRSAKADPLNPYEVLRPSKSAMAARSLLLMNPYLEVRVFEEGVTKDNMEEFLGGADFVAEEVDRMQVKLDIREAARKAQIPVFMASDIDERIFVEWADFKKDPQRSLALGVPDQVLYQALDRAQHGTKDDVWAFVELLIGPEFKKGEFGEWVQGKGEHATSSIPQHGATGMGAGLTAAITVGRYLLGHEIPSRQYLELKA